MVASFRKKKCAVARMLRSAIECTIALQCSAMPHAVTEREPFLVLKTRAKGRYVFIFVLNKY